MRMRANYSYSSLVDVETKATQRVLTKTYPF